MTERAQAKNRKKKTGASSVPAMLLALAVLGGGAYWFFVRRPPAQAALASASSGANSVSSVIHLDSFVVNLADTNQNAFLRIGIDLGVGGASERLSDKSSPAIPKIRDVILAVLTSMQSAALLAPDGKTKLKRQLLDAIQEQVPAVPVKEIYITEFLVQR